MNLSNTLQWTHHFSLGTSSDSPKYKFCNKTHEFIFSDGISMQRPLQLEKRMESLMGEIQEGCKELLSAQQQQNSGHSSHTSSKGSAKKKTSSAAQKDKKNAAALAKATIKLKEMQGVVDALIRSTAEFLWFIENKYENSTSEINILQQYVSLLRFYLRDIWHVHESKELALRCLFEERNATRRDYVEIGALFELLWNPDGALVSEWKSDHERSLIEFHDKISLAKMGVGTEQFDAEPSTTSLAAIPVDVLIQYALDNIGSIPILNQRPNLKSQIQLAVKKYYACIKFRDPLSRKPLLTHLMESTRSDEIFEKHNFDADYESDVLSQMEENADDPFVPLSPMELKVQLEEVLRNGSISAHFPDENPNYFSLGFSRHAELRDILTNMMDDDLRAQELSSSIASHLTPSQLEQRQFLYELHKQLGVHVAQLDGVNVQLQLNSMMEQVHMLRQLLQDARNQLFNGELESKIQMQAIEAALSKEIVKRFEGKCLNEADSDELKRLREENALLQNSQSSMQSLLDREQQLRLTQEKWHQRDVELRGQIEHLNAQTELLKRQHESELDVLRREMAAKYEAIISRHEAQLREMNQHNDDSLAFMRNEYINRLKDKDEVIQTQTQYIGDLQRLHEEQKNEIHVLLEKIHQRNLTMPNVHQSIQTDHQVYLTRKELREMRRIQGAVPTSQQGIGEITVEESEKINLSNLRQVLIYKNE
mmetsp:Transcript_2960/g.11309  ORF Transcript_2960/g.11309 Transcript_2960/m.11309 type:complete len:709 (-) Transcript_2960:4149-6275(-)